MKKFTVATIILSVLALSGCDDKQEKIDFYMKSENTAQYRMGLAKCKAGSSDAIDCDAIYEVEKMKKKDKTDDKKEEFKKKFSFDH